MLISTVDQHENWRSFEALASSTFSKGALFVHVQEKTKILAATRGACLRTFTGSRNHLGFWLDAILDRSGQEGLGPGYTLDPGTVGPFGPLSLLACKRFDMRIAKGFRNCPERMARLLLDEGHSRVPSPSEPRSGLATRLRSIPSNTAFRKRARMWGRFRVVTRAWSLGLPTRWQARGPPQPAIVGSEPGWISATEQRTTTVFRRTSPVLRVSVRRALRKPLRRQVADPGGDLSRSVIFACGLSSGTNL